MKPRVTLRHIAKKAGVHFTTVSRALRNHPALPEKTRLELQALANEMGYAPDPMMSALNAYRVARQRVIYHGTIAWLYGYPLKEDLFTRTVHFRLFQGARKRAEDLGYKLENFWLGGHIEPDMRSLEKVLAARNIHSLLVAPQFDSRSHLNLQWNRYSSISVSHSLGSPQLHMVTHDQCASLITIMRKLSALGYQRIGLLLDRRLIQITGHRWLSGYLVEREKAPPSNRLEFLDFENDEPDRTLLEWYANNRPDAIVTERGLWDSRLHALFRRDYPKKLGVAWVSTDGDSKFAGIVESSEGVGACAVDQLVRMEQSDERGIPSHPQRIFIEGDWFEGPSVRQQTGGTRTPSPRTARKAQQGDNSG